MPLESIQSVACMRPAGAPATGTQDVVWAAPSGSEGVYKSTDGGVTFAARPLPPTAPQPGVPLAGGVNVFRKIWVDPLDGNKVIVVGHMRNAANTINYPCVIKTTDGFVSDKQYLSLSGINPTLIFSSITDLHVVDFSGKIIIAKTARNSDAARSILDISLNGGTTWTNKLLNFFGVNNGFMHLEMGSASVGYISASSTGITGSGNGHMKKSIDGGETWSGINLPSSANDLRGLCFVSATVGFFCGILTPGSTPYAYKTVDGGSNFISILPPGLVLGDIPTTIEFFNENIGYLFVRSTTPSNNSKIYKTIDGGTNWNQETTPWSAIALNFFDAAIIQDTAAPSNGNRIFAASDGRTGPDLGKDCVIRRGS